jgi:F420H(2)-dependent quinone reductase
VVNPLARFAFRWGVPDPGDALLETVGRRSGRPQVTPVCDGLEADTFWLLSERGRRADWVQNIEAVGRMRRSAIELGVGRYEQCVWVAVGGILLHHRSDDLGR